MVSYVLVVYLSEFGGATVEETIKKMISIDKDAENFRRINDEILTRKRKELQSEIKTIMDDNFKLIEEEKIRIWKEEMYRAEQEILKIQAMEEEKIQRITASFRETKSVIESKVFDRLINSFEQV
jgi:hypothetical protein